MKQTTLILTAERPRTCHECVLLGDIPRGDYPEGSKWTHKCFLPCGQQRLISGRGSISPTARNRCKPREYQEIYLRTGGRVTLAQNVCDYYNIQQTLVFPPDEQVTNHINRRKR